MIDAISAVVPMALAGVEIRASMQVPAAKTAPFKPNVVRVPNKLARAIRANEVPQYCIVLIPNARILLEPS